MNKTVENEYSRRSGESGTEYYVRQMDNWKTEEIDRLNDKIEEAQKELQMNEGSIIESEKESLKRKISRLEGSLKAVDFKHKFFITYEPHEYGFDFLDAGFMDELIEIIAEKDPELIPDTDYYQTDDIRQEINEEISESLNASLPYDNYRCDMWEDLTDQGNKQGPKFEGRRINKGCIPRHPWANCGWKTEFESLRNTLNKKYDIEISKIEMKAVLSAAKGMIRKIYK